MKRSFIIIAALILSALLTPPAVANAAGGIIVIDPGHGGGDSGAVGPSGFKEKEANLDIGLRVRRLLVRGGYSVILTRSTDICPNTPPKDLTGDGRISVADDLQARVDIANNAKAEIFVSIHNNAAVSSARGTETYYYGSRSAAESDGARLARFIQEEVEAQIGLYDRGVKSANFYVLRRTDMPAALVEGAFITNPTEESLLKTPKWRQKLAQGIYNGIRRYMGRVAEPKFLSFQVGPRSQKVIDLNNYFYNKAVGSKLTADVPITVERSMYFNVKGTAAGTGSRGVRRPARSWYFAEGFTAPGFDTWLLLVNPNRKRTKVRIQYVTSKGTVKRGFIKLPAKRRRSIHVNDVLPNQAFAMKIRAGRRIIAERSMYFKSGGRRGGHNSMGIRKPSRRRYFTNGRTGPHYDAWLLLYNPNNNRAFVRINYYAASGRIGGRRVKIPAGSRRSVLVDKTAADSEVAVAVTSGRKIVAEQSVYFKTGAGSGGYISTGTKKLKRVRRFTGGPTGNGFSRSIILFKPNGSGTPVFIDYLTDDDEVVKTSTNLLPGTRLTIDPVAAGVGAGKNISILVRSGAPIVADRSVFLNQSPYNGAGATGISTPGKNWFFAEGFTGGGFRTVLTITNLRNEAAKVGVRFFKE